MSRYRISVRFTDKPSIEPLILDVGKRAYNSYRNGDSVDWCRGFTDHADACDDICDACDEACPVATMVCAANGESECTDSMCSDMIGSINVLTRIIARRAVVYV